MVCLESHVSDDGGHVGLQIGMAISVGNFLFSPGNKDLDGPILLLADRGVMDSTLSALK